MEGEPSAKPTPSQRRTYSQPASDQQANGGLDEMQAHLPMRPNTEAGDSAHLPEWAREMNFSSNRKAAAAAEHRAYGHPESAPDSHFPYNGYADEPYDGGPPSPSCGELERGGREGSHGAHAYGAHAYGAAQAVASWPADMPLGQSDGGIGYNRGRAMPRGPPKDLAIDFVGLPSERTKPTLAAAEFFGLDGPMQPRRGSRRSPPAAVEAAASQSYPPPQQQHYAQYAQQQQQHQQPAYSPEGYAPLHQYAQQQQHYPSYAPPQPPQQQQYAHIATGHQHPPPGAPAAQPARGGRRASPPLALTDDDSYGAGGLACNGAGGYQDGSAPYGGYRAAGAAGAAMGGVLSGVLTEQNHQNGPSPLQRPPRQRGGDSSSSSGAGAHHGALGSRADLPSAVPSAAAVGAPPPPVTDAHDGATESDGRARASSGALGRRAGRGGASSENGSRVEQ